jgi:hypothetical protein
MPLPLVDNGFHSQNSFINLPKRSLNTTDLTAEISLWPCIANSEGQAEFVAIQINLLHHVPLNGLDFVVIY